MKGVLMENSLYQVQLMEEGLLHRLKKSNYKFSNNKQKTTAILRIGRSDIAFQYKRLDLA